VLVVPEEREEGSGILIAYDGSRGANRVIVPAAIMASKLGEKVVVVIVQDDLERANRLQRIVERYLTPYNIKVTYVLEHGRPSNQILGAAKEHQVGLIAMGAFNQNPVRELFFGSTTLSVLEDTACSLLMMA